MYIEHFKHILIKKVPVIKSLYKYSKSDAATDLLAGVTVGLMLIPQSIAYAALAGLNPQYGLYSAISGGFIYAIFGTVKEVTIGPTALLALLTYQYAHDSPCIAAFLSFITGCICMLFGFLNLGFIINFVSTPVISGYTSAAAVVIASSQIKGILGLQFTSKSFLSTVSNLVENIGATNFSDASLGIICILILILLKEMYKFEPFKHMKLFFYISVGKNLFVVFISSTLAYVCQSFGKSPFTLTGNITDGLPSISVPSFTATYEGEERSFFNLLQMMGFGITTIVLIAIISEIVVAKVFIKSDRMDASQEVIALGAANLVGSFLGAMPVAGSFSRSAVNSSCNVKTPLAGVYSALLVIFALLYLTPLFYYIPKSALSAIIITAVVYMVEYDVILPIWKNNRKDIIPGLGTFVSALCFGIEFGLICGLLIDMAFFLYYSTFPNMSVDKSEENQIEYLIFTPKNGLLYPSANCLQEKILTEVGKSRNNKHKKIVLNLKHIFLIDFTTLQTLANLMKDIRSNNYEFIITNVNETIKSKVVELSHCIHNIESLDIELMRSLEVKVV